MSLQVKERILLLAVGLLFIAPAHAYVGPGLGAGTLGVILGLLGSVLVAVFAFFWYPIKRTLKRWFGSAEDKKVEEEQPDTPEEP